MNTDKYVKNLGTLINKTIAVTGTTGGIGKVVCRYIALLRGNLILINRNKTRAEKQKAELEAEFPTLKIIILIADLSDIESVKAMCETLKKHAVDILILNAGAYSVPRFTTTSGLDNVFQINFAAQYYIAKQMLKTTMRKNAKIIAVGSIAHNYSRLDKSDFDFKCRKSSALVYGNSKRFLMFSLFELFKNRNDVSLAVCHPGITFTNITAHYPKLLFAIIKNPMKVIFMKPKKAALSIIDGCFKECEERSWIGPRFFNIWGKPTKKKLNTCTLAEQKEIFEIAESIYNGL